MILFISKMMVKKMPGSGSFLDESEKNRRRVFYMSSEKNRMPAYADLASTAITVETCKSCFLWLRK